MQQYLDEFGHEFVELERGSLDTRIWKDVKRKRIRIPDLVCKRCGVRIESRAKLKAELAMSHSPADAERSWDYGMVPSDWIAFPVCVPQKEHAWSEGSLRDGRSLWRERSWTRWATCGTINVFSVDSFRS
ncbi:MAG: HEAT repeat domain-containing protein, partial [Phycisphaerae bacterium]